MNATTTQTKARRAIREATNHQPNIFTPYAVRFGMVRSNLAWELSQGEGIDRETLLVGVTFAVREAGEWKPDYDRSTSFVSARTADRLDIAQTDAAAYQEALAYIAAQ